MGFENLGEFLLHLHDEENEAKMYEIWLHKVVEQTYNEFRNDLLANVRSTSTKPDKDIVAFESRFITDVGGDAYDG